MSRLSRVSVLLILLCTSACFGNIFGPDKPSPITAFVNGQGLHDRQPVQIIMRNDDKGVIFFKVDFGSPQDIPSGAFYSSGYGLKCRAKIGWLRVYDYDYIVDLESLDYFNLESTDTALFNENIWAWLKTANEWVYWGPFFQMLASDPDTPASKLYAISMKLRNYIYEHLAWLLLDNPVVQGNRDILSVLATLSGPGDCYLTVRERAQELLNALGPGRI